MNRESTTCVLADELFKPKRFKRIVITFIAVLLVYGGVELAHRRLSPLRDSPLIEFPADPMPQSEIEQFLGGDFQIIKDLKLMPKSVIEAFTETGGSRLTIVNPGQRYEVTDVAWDPSLPRKRLLFAGVSGHKCFMLYEQGGILHFYVLALFKLSPPNVLTPIWQASCEPAADIAELRPHVSMGVCSQPTPFYSVPYVVDHRRDIAITVKTPQ